MFDYKIIATGSAGNAVLALRGRILIDCGVGYKRLVEYVDKIQLVLLTHEHRDHFNAPTVRRLAEMRPLLRFACSADILPALLAVGVRRANIDLVAPEHTYGYGAFVVEPVQLWHDVPNIGWKIIAPEGKLFYATDTATLDGVSAPGFDVYLIEANHEEREIAQKIHDKQKNDTYAYEKRAQVWHLSREKAWDWLQKNAGKNSKIELIHEHRERGI